MRWKRTSAAFVGALVGVACGGAKPAPVAQPAPAPKPTRVIVEDKEPDEGVTIVRGHGHVDEPERKLSPLHAELSQCYTTRVGARRWLGGRVELHWEIAADGTIAKVVLARSDLGAWPIEKCLVEVARTAAFGKPVGGAADVSLPLEFTAPASAEEWDDDRIDKALGKVLGKQLAKLDACGKTEPPPDDVTITMYVGTRGKAQSVGFASPKSELSETWVECAQKAMEKWKLPDPRGAVAKLAVKYRPR
jgi:hypothetical protein